MKSQPELFVLEDDESQILYAPLVGKMARVNAGACEAVRRELDGYALDSEQQDVVNILRHHGFFNTPPPPQVAGSFEPTHVTLFPTDACNLRCRYCYASAEEGAHKLSMEAARAAIDLVAENAKRLERPNFLVGFHGNGEPFMGFDVIKECCEYTLETAQRVGVRGVLNTATNGVLSESQLDYLIAYISAVNISSDILPDLQNRQRPFPDGSGSFDVVDHAIKRIDKAGVHYGIRATLTEQSVHRMVEMADFVTEHYPNCQMVHLEPAWEVGRALVTGEKMPLADQFVEQYLTAVEKLGDKGVRLVYSGARMDIVVPTFCSLCRNSFTVSAEGNVTACYEVCTEDDPRSERYIIGRYDRETHRFVFNQEKMDALESLSVHNIPYCKDCFCKWHCAGDCAAKLLGGEPPESHRGSMRCIINRALTKNQILRQLGKEEKEAVHV